MGIHSAHKLTRSHADIPILFQYAVHVLFSCDSAFKYSICLPLDLSSFRKMLTVHPAKPQFFASPASCSSIFFPELISTSCTVLFSSAFLSSTLPILSFTI